MEKQVLLTYRVLFNEYLFSSVDYKMQFEKTSF